MSATTSSPPPAPPPLGRASNKPGGFFAQGSTSTARRHSHRPIRGQIRGQHRGPWADIAQIIETFAAMSRPTPSSASTPRNSAFDFVLPILSSSSSIASTGDSGFSTLRSTQTRLRSSRGSSSSSLRVPLF